MCQYLPTGNFVEIEVIKGNKENVLKSILSTKDDHKHGYFIECDLENPQNLHKKTKHFAIWREKKWWNE